MKNTKQTNTKGKPIAGVMFTLIIAMLLCISATIFTSRVFVNASAYEDTMPMELSERDLNCLKSMEAFEDIIVDFENPSAQNGYVDLKMYNENYAGAYFDEAGCLVFCTVNMDSLDVGSHADKVIHKNYKYSYNQLETVQMAIAGVMREIGVASVSLREDKNWVEVEVKDDSDSVIRFLKDTGLYEEGLVSNEGTISGANVGGIVGQASNTTIVNCINYGEIYGSVVGGIAGFLGLITRNLLVNNYNMGEVDGGGVAGTLQRATAANNYSGSFYGSQQEIFTLFMIGTQSNNYLLANFTDAQDLVDLLNDYVENNNLDPIVCQVTGETIPLKGWIEIDGRAHLDI